MTGPVATSVRGLLTCVGELASGASRVKYVVCATEAAQAFWAAEISLVELESALHRTAIQTVRQVTGM